MDRDRVLSLLDSYARTRLDARALHPLLLELAEVVGPGPHPGDGRPPGTSCRPHEPAIHGIPRFSLPTFLSLESRSRPARPVGARHDLPWFPDPPWCRGSVRWSPACPPNWPRSRWSGSTEPSGCTIRNTNASTWRSRDTKSERRRRSSKANSGPDHSTPDTRKMTSTRPTRCCSQVGLKWSAKESEVPIRMPARPAV